MVQAAFDQVSNLGAAPGSTGVSGNFTLGASATELLVIVSGTQIPQPTLTATIPNSGSANVTSTTLATSTGWMTIYKSLHPPTGVQAIAVSATGTSIINVTAISFTGVTQTGTPVPNSGTSAAVSSGTIASGTNNRVVFIVAAPDAVITPAGSASIRSNQPNPAVSNTMTICVTDISGAATVSQSATLGASAGWLSVSINLIAGTAYTVGATLALALARAQAASTFGGHHWTVGSTLALATSTAATGLTQFYGPPLRYVGRPPDTSSTLVTAGYALQDVANDLVSASWVAQQVAAAAAPLVPVSWINGQITPPSGVGGYLSQAAVTTALTSGFVPDSALVADSGIAQLGSNPNNLLIPSAQLPTLVTNSLATCYDANTSGQGTVWLNSGVVLTAITHNIGEQLLAQVDIVDPGYPYIALPFAYVQGYSSIADTGPRTIGSGDNYGLLTVTALGTQSPIYGMGLCNNSPYPNYYVVTPGGYPAQNVVPTSQPPLVGDQTLQLAGCNYNGSDYTFTASTAAPLVFYVLIFPAFGG